jgi:hypothetical protein
VPSGRGHRRTRDGECLEGAFQDRDWCRQVPPTPTWSVKTVEVLCRIDTVRHTWNADGTLATDPTTPSGYRETLTQAISITSSTTACRGRINPQRRRHATSCSYRAVSA